MKQYLLIGMLVFAAGAGAQERSASTLKWVRRGTLAASCGTAMGFDTWALHRAVSQGARLSGLYADSQGKPRYGLMLGINGASCAFSAFLQERHKDWSNGSEMIWIIENSAATGLFTWTGIHLLNVGNASQAALAAPAAERTQPGTLALPTAH